jgi:1-acyl-sn-glycerol-3-phosphate acyltransferase
VKNSLRGILSLVLMALNTLLWTVPILLFYLFKVSLPARGWRRFWSRAQNAVGAAWIGFNNLNLRFLNPARWDVEGLDGLDPEAWYLVMANHQSWVDILVLQKVFNRRIPFLKFFLKKQLFWVPFLGLAWWALDYPFLERSSNPRRDLEMIRKAAEKFQVVPVSVMNFVEGTRFTHEKHEKQRSPYRHLLKPKAGGLTSILTAMDGHFRSILDVTIAYPGGAPTMWQFLKGDVEEIRIRVRERAITEEILGDFGTDKVFRRRFLTWLNGVWKEKDRELVRLLDRSGDATIA